MLENCKSFGQSQRDGRSADRQSKKISKIATNARQNYFKSKRHLSDCFLFVIFPPLMLKISTSNSFSVSADCVL